MRAFNFFLLRLLTHRRRQVPVADILCCKPSELAFYPLPKLMIRRVGDHEAHSATRAVRFQALDTHRLSLRTPPLAYAYVYRASVPDGLLSHRNTRAIFHICWEGANPGVPNGIWWLPVRAATATEKNRR